MDQSDNNDIYASHSKCTCDRNQTRSMKLPSTWKHAMSQVTRSMYSSTAIGVPTPDPHLGVSDVLCPYCQQRRRNVAFNTDPFGAMDLRHYREQRSEHILFRIFHKCPLEFDDINILRINKGVFLAQQTHPLRYTDQTNPDGLSSTWLDSFLNDSFALPMDTQSIAPVYNFNRNDLTDLITSHLDGDNTHDGGMHQRQTPSTPDIDFIPYTYTVGSRYTDMNQQDYMIEGAIPLWCQSLVLFAIYSAQPPIMPNETRYGLISFAPELPLSFVAYPQTKSSEEVHQPEVLLWYERLAMDNVGDYVDDTYGDAYCGVNERAVLDKLVYCNIPPDLSQLITSLASTWAVNEGYLLG